MQVSFGPAASDVHAAVVLPGRNTTKSGSCEPVPTNVTLIPVAPAGTVSKYVYVEFTGPPTVKSVSGNNSLIVDVAVLPSLVAVTVNVPGVTTVTNPVDDTVPVAADDEDHVTIRSVTTSPVTSFTSVVS